ncbi:MAG: UDP-glucose--hexose-1-phosphate uridylyltransferase, partial [Lancefieldella parvula]
MAVADNESALCIQRLVAYACKHGLIKTEDLTWCYNALLDMLSYEGPAPVKSWNKIDLASFNLDQTLAEL